MTHPDRDPTVTEPWREAYEAWLKEPQAASATAPKPDEDDGHDWFERACANCFRAGFLAALEARAQPSTFTEEQIERAISAHETAWAELQRQDAGRAWGELSDAELTEHLQKSRIYAMRAALSTLPAQPVRVTVEGVEPSPNTSEAEPLSQLLSNVLGPHEWGYRDVTDGAFISDGAPFRLADRFVRFLESNSGTARHTNLLPPRRLAPMTPTERARLRHLAQANKLAHHPVTFSAAHALELLDAADRLAEAEKALTPFADECRRQMEHLQRMALNLPDNETVSLHAFKVRDVRRAAYFSSHPQPDGEPEHLASRPTRPPYFRERLARIIFDRMDCDGSTSSMRSNWEEAEIAADEAIALFDPPKPDSREENET